jgi:hypothetical protein
LNEDETAALEVRRIAVRLPGRSPVKALAMLYSGWLSLEDGGRLDSFRPCEEALPSETERQWKAAIESQGNDVAREAVRAALLAAGPLAADGKLLVSEPFSKARSSPGFDDVYDHCVNGQWFEAAAMIRTLDFSSLSITDDAIGDGVSYVNPLYAMAMGRVLGQVVRNVGFGLLAHLPVGKERSWVLDWLAASCLVSGSRSDAETLAGQELSWRGMLLVGECLSRRDISESAPRPAAPEAQIEYEALQARLICSSATPAAMRSLEGTYRRLHSQLQDLILKMDVSGAHPTGIELDRDKLPELRTAFFEVIQLGQSLGLTAEALQLARIALADLTPGQCGGRVDPVQLLILSRLEWEMSQLSWEYVLKMGRCLSTTVGNKPIMFVDMVNRWAAALCVEPTGLPPRLAE